MVCLVAMAVAACSASDDSDAVRTTVTTSPAATAVSQSPTTAAPTTEAPTTTEAAPTTTNAPTTTMATTTTIPEPQVWVDPASSGQPWPGATTVGMLTFRGNPTRSYYGQGPVPRTAPSVLWRYPRDRQMCSDSTSEGVTKQWCGTGWTGQPNLWERPDGSTWVMFGAYDRAYHVLDAATGDEALPSLPTGDINKGSATLDPDGFPLYYAGSRDNLLRVVALDRAEPTVLWSLDAQSVNPRIWNDDWDGAPILVGDYLVEGGENSRLHVIKLNRGYGPDGLVTVAPELVFSAAGWDDQLLADIGDRKVSIENSVAIAGDIAYFGNSGGLVQGWDLSGYRDGSGREPTRVFRYWMGDDTDASVVVDSEGYLYVAAEYERKLPRAREVGQLVKLDPRNPDNPLVWSFADQGSGGDSGIWSTPALHKGVVITTTHGGRAIGLDQATGAVLWTKRLGGQAWQSPVIVDDVWIQGDCGGVLKAYDVADPRVDPPLLWELTIGGCLEATPTVWKGRIYLGSRNGFFYAIG